MRYLVLAALIAGCTTPNPAAESSSCLFDGYRCVDVSQLRPVAICSPDEYGQVGVYEACPYHGVRCYHCLDRSGCLVGRDAVSDGYWCVDAELGCDDPMCAP